MKQFLLLALFSLIAFSAGAKTVRYELTATKSKVNLSGKREVRFALMLNGSIPAPTLEFTEGDEAEIVLKNEIPDDELSVHWHGILLDPYMDGVPYVNTPPIFPGESFTYKFKVRQNGTYWYHSHTNVQEQKGVYGAIVIHPKEKKIKYEKDLVVVLSDWTDENPSQVLKNLRKDGEYYLFKKGTMRSWWGAYKANSLGNYIYNEWTRMGGMDYSDVGYDAFLINGKVEQQLPDFKPNEKVRIRIINAAASSYFYVSLGDIPMNVISADGVDIKPTLANEFLVGMAETYDVLFEVPANKSFELKATAQDGTGKTSLWIGQGDKVFAPERPKPDLYMKMYMGTVWDTIKYTGSMTKSPMNMSSMDHSKMDMSSMDHSKMDMGSMDHSKMDMSSMDHSKMDMSSMDHSKMDHGSSQIIQTLTVNDLESQTPTNFPSSKPRQNVKLILDGDMERYIWVINGKAINEDRTINIKQNEVIRFTFVNNSMMHHPMHLHGHFFRVINKFGNNSPMKHTLDVAPHSEKTIEFYSDEPGEWMLHCHNLYHLKTGMARVVKYSSFTPNKEIKSWQKHDPHMHDHLYYRGMLEASTNHAQAQLNLLNTWNELELRTELRNDFGWQGEGDAFYKRWLNKYTNLILGGTLIEREGAGVAGVGYILPFLIETHSLIDHKGRLRLDLEKRFQWTQYIYTDAEFTFRQKQPSEFEISLMYQNNWSWSAGLMFTEHSAGIGGQYNF
ncbi:MAG: multicopper oxidase domain-containing protein [Bacteriovoracaceae bacterium]|nr:multicopper oxidase domain-containing protein [Bacteriovoracaceae bacterium]